MKDSNNIDSVDLNSRTGDKAPCVVTELLTVAEAAALLRISRNLAYELVAQRKLPAIHFGRVIRIPRGHLEEWLAKQAADSLSTPASVGVKYRR